MVEKAVRRSSDRETKGFKKSGSREYVTGVFL
jgi:hypothetical protein